MPASDIVVRLIVVALDVAGKAYDAWQKQRQRDAPPVERGPDVKPLNPR